VTKQVPQQNSKPFLKWAGGKYRIMDRIQSVLPAGTRLIEPFAGSAAVCLNTDYSRYWLNDVNVDLVNVYRQLTHNHADYIDFTESLFIPSNNQAKRYYQIRQQFNDSQDDFERSALFLYLNRHGYNGLCRYNSKGIFNAPFGRYKKPYFPKIELQQFTRKAPQIKLTHDSFEKVMLKAKPGDVIYCDPPYVPISRTASFTQYSQQSFLPQQQEQLSELAMCLADKGIPVIISNHDTTFTRKIYRQAKLSKFLVPRYISCNGQDRTPAKELLAVFQS
jgi:DNA adenine methylase